MADFASKYMASKGWTQGNGLGRSLQGRKDPVKVKFKFDINGLGHDRAEEDKYKWWEYAFKTAADSIQVGKDNKVEKVEGKAGPIVSTSRPLSKSLNRAMLYGTHFVRKGILQSGKLVKDDSDDSDSSTDEDEVKRGKVVDISDEALFAACGGMTGHKGARHGINMTAKLDRIKNSEAEGLRKMKLIYQKGIDSGISSPQEDTSTAKSCQKKSKEPELEYSKEILEQTSESPKRKTKKSKKTKSDNTDEMEGINQNTDGTVIEDTVSKKKKKSKKSKKQSQENEAVPAENEISMAEIPLEESFKKKMKKSKKRKSESDPAIETEPARYPEQSPKKMKKVKKDKENDKKVEVEADSNSACETRESSKKIKKSKNETCEAETLESVENERRSKKKKKPKKISEEELGEISVPKKKKKKNKD